MLPLAAIFTLSQALTPRLIAARQTSNTWGHATVEQQVNTTSGLVNGLPAPDYPSVNAYLGVPFAEPPLTDLRFAPPSPYIAKDPINADTLPLSCIQSPSEFNYSLPEPARGLIGGGGDFANHASEESLYLNVWTRFSNTKDLKPVLI